VESFAVIDNKAGSSTIATWVVARLEPLVVRNTNAVVVDMDTESDALAKVRLLTRSRIVVLTDRSIPEGLPLDFAPLSIEDIGLLIAETARLQELIGDAVEAYAWRPSLKTGSLPTSRRNIVPPRFPAGPTTVELRPHEDSPVGRALATANLLSAAWSTWLETEDERRRRCAITDGIIWMLPDDVREACTRALPPALAERAHIEP
jgi:hypothetical protein